MLFYHLTLASNRRSIERQGLQPSVDEMFDDREELLFGVNLASTREPKYRDPTADDMFCVIDGTKLDQTLLVQLDSWWHRYCAVIPPHAITFS